MPHAIQRKKTTSSSNYRVDGIRKNMGKVTCEEISSRRVKHIIFKSAGNPRQYYKTTLSEVP